MTGLIRLGGIHQYHPSFGQRISIARGKCGTDEQVLPLAPSPQLFKKFLNDWKGKPGSAWWSEYESDYWDGLRSCPSPVFGRAMDRILKSRDPIFLYCFCQGSEFCHRSLAVRILRHNAPKAGRSPQSIILL